GKNPESRPLPEQVFIDEDQAGPDPGESRATLARLNIEPTYDDFMANVYPNVHESLKFMADEHVIIEDPLSSTRTLSLMNNLDDAYTIGDQFLNDKSIIDELGKLNVEAKVVSMVTVPIYQASSLVPPLSTLVIDLLAYKHDDASPNIVCESLFPTDAETCADTDKTNSKEEKTAELDQGQAESSPGKNPESRPLPEQVFIDEDQAGPDPGESRPKLGNLKFIPKGEDDEVFRMPIPNKSISINIKNAPYYNAYLEMVSKHDQKVVAEKGAKKKPATTKQLKSKPVKEKSSKPAPTSKPKEALEITPIVQARQFVLPPSGDAIMDFVNELGYTEVIRFVSRIAVNNLYQPWRAILSMINQCLTSKTS
nr:hypothetical protein [Tanacetum cinerariifolium]